VFETPGKSFWIKTKHDTRGKGSRFLFQKKTPQKHMPVMVTNAHVPNHAVLLPEQMDILLYNQSRKQMSDHVQYL
jgi:hypothetical protein